ncbi:hypothetical protein Veis_2411 [Verminephrobacter eiseniae EF01-2]|uniref:Uncharacterized protein n=1 Tax=Verminephrobacter eiseniae (strain EF01-2) TaxID=391735 RepID=A1WKK0_VEREI|nr:hypothetical protein Veis_2411 [Verminephrobacter eiseniae EF01-2]MCW8182282.1 hypothetical protein [Verminephrobacter eiseniae]
MASDATPRCASMASADRQMIGDATLGVQPIFRRDRPPRGASPWGASGQGRANESIGVTVPTGTKSVRSSCKNRHPDPRADPWADLLRAACMGPHRGQMRTNRLRWPGVSSEITRLVPAERFWRHR